MDRVGLQRGLVVADVMRAQGCRLVAKQLVKGICAVCILSVTTRELKLNFKDSLLFGIMFNKQAIQDKLRCGSIDHALDKLLRVRHVILLCKTHLGGDRFSIKLGTQNLRIQMEAWGFDVQSRLIGNDLDDVLDLVLHDDDIDAVSSLPKVFAALINYY